MRHELKSYNFAEDIPRVELFARQAPIGWDVWGNQVDNSIDLDKKLFA